MLDELLAGADETIGELVAVNDVGRLGADVLELEDAVAEVDAVADEGAPDEDTGAEPAGCTGALLAGAVERVGISGAWYVAFVGSGRIRK